MRIAFLIYGSLETLSGGYLYDRKLVEALERRGDRVEVLSLPWRDYPHHLLDNFSPALSRRLARLPADLLLQDELNHPSLFWLNKKLCQRVGSPGYPVISIVHHLRSSEARPAWQNSFYGWVERRYLSSVDGFIFNSRTTQKVVEGLVGDQRPALVAYPGGDRLQPDLGEEVITRRAHRPGPLQVLFLGSLIPRKGLHILLAALALIPKDLWRLTITGRLDADPSYVRQVRRILADSRTLADSRLVDRVQITGPLRDVELKKLLQSSHILAVPSSYEGFGIVFLEGMGFGLPAVGTRAGAAPEIITDGQDGFLIEPGDVHALADHLQLVALDRDRLLALGLAARKRYQAHPTWEQTAERVRQFLATLSEREPKQKSMDDTSLL